jgi:hypothetical protein
VTTYDLGALDEPPQRALKVRRALEPPVRDSRAEADGPVDLDRIKSGDTLQADDVARVQPATMDLDHEIRSPGEEAPVAAEPSAELDRLAHRCRLMVVEGHHIPPGGAGPWRYYAP